MPDKSELKKVILRVFHVKTYLGHLGYQKTLTVVKRIYYSINLNRDVAEFVAKCFDFEHVKVDCKHPSGLLQLIVILEWKLEVISMDFITRFPRTVRQNDSIMVVVGKLKKVVHFILVKSTFSTSNVA